jgi:hypothetical protein
VIGEVAELLLAASKGALGAPPLGDVAAEDEPADDVAGVAHGRDPDAYRCVPSSASYVNVVRSPTSAAR